MQNSPRRAPCFRHGWRLHPVSLRIVSGSNAQNNGRLTVVCSVKWATRSVTVTACTRMWTAPRTTRCSQALWHTISKKQKYPRLKDFKRGSFCYYTENVSMYCDSVERISMAENTTINSEQLSANRVRPFRVS